MSSRKILAVAACGTLLAGGAGVAIAAVSNDDRSTIERLKVDRSKVERAILDDAAKRLNVTPEKLRDALAAAQDAQLDKPSRTASSRRSSPTPSRRGASGPGTCSVARRSPVRRRVPGRGRSVPGHGPRPGPGFPGHGRAFGGLRRGFGAAGLDLAKALGITREQLGEQLRAGKSIADIAKAQGKSLSDVRTALKAAAKAKLDKAVEDGKLTKQQADRLRARINEGIDHVGTAPAFPRMRRHEFPFEPTP